MARAIFRICICITNILNWWIISNYGNWSTYWIRINSIVTIFIGTVFKCND